MPRDVRSVRVGDTVRWNGSEWMIEAFTGRTLHLRSREGLGRYATAHEDVMLAEDFQVLKSTGPDRLYGVKPSYPLDEFPAEVAEQAREIEADLLRVLTGFATASPAPDAEPDRTCDGMSVKQRCSELGRRRGVSQRQAERWKARYDKFGVAGLANEKHLHLTGGAANIHPLLQQVILGVLDATLDSSRLTNNEIRDRVRRALNETEGGAGLMPHERTFNRYLRLLTAGKPRHLTMASQRNARSRTPGVVPWSQATRPMQVVMLDGTPLDMLTVDPFAGPKDPKWARIYLTVAICEFSRSIVAWVFTCGPARSEDISLLLYRMAAPKIFEPGWPERARWRYPGAPEALVFQAAHDVNVSALAVAGVPFGAVEEIRVDHGKEYISLATRQAADVLGASLQLARIRTPTDKPHVERVFSRIREQFVMPLPGYKGNDVASRGARSDVEDGAFMFLHEVDAAFAEWVACDYQTTVHRGLQFQSCPDLLWTPNEAYDYGITRSGLLPIPPPRDLLIELLPTAWRTVQEYGVEVNRVRYDSNVLNDYRMRRSPWTGKKNQWKIKSDRTDRSRIWFWAMDLDQNDTSIGRWEPLYYRGWQDAPMFGEEEIAYVKNIIIGRGGDLSNHEQFESTLDRVLLRNRQQQDLPESERRMSGRTYLRAAGRADAHPETRAAGDGTAPPHTAPARVFTADDLMRNDDHPTRHVDRTHLDDGGQRPAGSTPALLTMPDVMEMDFFPDDDEAIGENDYNGGQENLAHEDRDNHDQ